MDAINLIIIGNLACLVAFSGLAIIALPAFKKTTQDIIFVLIITGLIGVFLISIANKYLYSNFNLVLKNHVDIQNLKPPR